MIRKLLLPAMAVVLLAGCVSDYGYRSGNGDYYYGQPSIDYQYDGYYPYGGMGYGYPGGWSGMIGYGLGYGSGYGPYGYYGGYPYDYPYGYGYPYYPRPRVIVVQPGDPSVNPHHPRPTGPVDPSSPSPPIVPRPLREMQSGGAPQLSDEGRRFQMPAPAQRPWTRPERIQFESPRAPAREVPRDPNQDRDDGPRHHH